MKEAEDSRRAMVWVKCCLNLGKIFLETLWESYENIQAVYSIMISIRISNQAEYPLKILGKPEQLSTTHLEKLMLKSG